MVFVLRNQYSSWRPNEIDFLKLHTNFIQNTSEELHVETMEEEGPVLIALNLNELVNMNCN